eukprot:5975925-Lingulodinium_polyedra.AAC.1
MLGCPSATRHLKQLIVGGEFPCRWGGAEGGLWHHRPRVRDAQHELHVPEGAPEVVNGFAGEPFEGRRRARPPALHAASTGPG